MKTLNVDNVDDLTGHLNTRRGINKNEDRCDDYEQESGVTDRGTTPNRTWLKTSPKLQTKGHSTPFQKGTFQMVYQTTALGRTREPRRSTEQKQNKKTGQVLATQQHWEFTWRTHPQEQAQSGAVPSTLPRDRKQEEEHPHWLSFGTGHMAKGVNGDHPWGQGTWKRSIPGYPLQEQTCEE